MPHMNHRRGDTRHRCRPDTRQHSEFGGWNDCANRRYRMAVRELMARVRRMLPEDLDRVIWPLQDETDDVWAYD